ncbi:SWI/SNF complex subunit SWI3C [Euphorbia peplus]|nr:SWI/SNF complex subunit SWI3C [Euphorbia peplus]
MPASPSFHSDGRGKWKRRKREPLITRKHQPKHEDPDDDDEDDPVDDDNNNRDDDFDDPNPNHHHTHVESEVLVDNGVRISDFPTVTKIAVNRPHSSVIAISALERANLVGDTAGSRGLVPDLENVSHGQLQALSAVPAEGFGTDQEAYVITPPPILEGKGVVKRFGSRVHIVPLHSDWFSPAVVNRLERQVVPHFFSGKSPEHSPQKYMECRNYIVARYMENPEKRVTVSDCLGSVVGIEDEDLARILRFLDHWGIINYCAAVPSRESWNGGSYLREDSNGSRQLRFIHHCLVVMMISLTWTKKFGRVCLKIVVLIALSLFLAYTISHKKRLTYCYVLTASTKEEHVGTKSKSQCILHFLRLPMGDGLLEKVEVPTVSKSSNSSSRDDSTRFHSRSNGDTSGPCLQDLDSESRIPFANSGNPIMSLVAFLASAVGPRVAAACAHASLAALSEDHKTNSERSNGREGNFHGEVANSVQRKEENLHSSWSQNETDGAPLSAEKVNAAAKVGLAAAATKAKLFADHEEREIQRLSANIINHQLKRLELKLKQFAEVETLLMRECEQVEKTRQRFAAERVRLLSTRVGPAGSTSQMNLAGISPSMVVNNMGGGNNRQQVVSPTSSSQPSVSGFGNNQQVHPHLSFMQRGQAQPMFPLGPRLPLSAIQPSSSAPPNAMFNASGNSQPNLNQMLRSVSGPSSGLG